MCLINKKTHFNVKGERANGKNWDRLIHYKIMCMFFFSSVITCLVGEIWFIIRQNSFLSALPFVHFSHVSCSSRWKISFRDEKRENEVNKSEIELFFSPYRRRVMVIKQPVRYQLLLVVRMLENIYHARHTITCHLQMRSKMVGN